MPNIGPVYWHYWLKPYVRSTQVFICPDAGGCSASEGPPSLTVAERQAGVKGCAGFGGTRAVFDREAVPATPWAYGSGSYGWNACFISASKQTGARGSQQWVVGYPESMTLSEISHAAETPSTNDWIDLFPAIRWK